MIINHNMQALNAHRQMGANATNAQKSMEKLSSGLRINRAGDDAAGLAISEKMRGQIRGLDQAGRNAQDGISLIQTAEGALQETHSILQRMRELSVQSANDTNTDNDRAELQKEINQLIDEIDRISDNTEFNNKTLLDGNLAETKATGKAVGVNARTAPEMEVTKPVNGTITGTPTLTEGDYKLTVSSDGSTATLTTAAGEAVDGAVVTKEGDLFKVGGLEITPTPKGESGSETINGVEVTFTVAAKKTEDPGTTEKPSATTPNLDGWKDKDGNALTTGDGVPTVNSDAYTGVNGTVTFEVKEDDKGNKYLEASQDGKTIGKVEKDTTRAAGDTYTFHGAKIAVDLDNVGTGSKFSVTFAGSDESTAVTKDGPLKFQVGANSGQNISVSINDMGSDKLGTVDADGNVTASIKDLKVETGTTGGVLDQTSADSAITVINDAINQVSSERSKLGAIQNRLEHTINNLGTSSENLTAAESRIRDVDMAKEMMTMSKNNILQQASQAMLAQANQNPQQVLQLLR